MNITIPPPDIQVVKKGADETISNSSVLQNDDALYFAIGANQSVSFSLQLYYISSAVADLKIKFTAPAGAAGLATFVTAGGYAAFDPLAQYDYGASGVEEIISIAGFILNGATAGEVRLQWAQLSAEVSNTKVKAGSVLVVFK